MGARIARQQLLLPPRMLKIVLAACNTLDKIAEAVTGAEKARLKHSIGGAEGAEPTAQ